VSRSSAHWATNSFCERLAIWMVTTIESGTASTERRARIGSMVSMSTRMPMTVRTEVISWVRLCWRV